MTIEKDMTVGVGYCDACLIRVFKDEHITYQYTAGAWGLTIVCDDCKEIGAER